MKKNIIYIICVTIIFSSCSLFVEKGEPVAKVGDKVLTMDELSRNIPDYLEDSDSIIWAEDFIKKWVQRELLLMKAEENLKIEMKDVENELEEYRNSLIMYRYKNELMKQKLDTVVSDDKVLKYFNDHRESFKLNRNIVKAIYIKIPVEFSSPEKIKDLCSSKDPDSESKLNEYCVSYAKAYDRFNDQWVAADLVLKNTPIEITDQSYFITKTRFIESNDINFYYLVFINEYRLIGQTAPVDYVRNEIKNLILNKQKIEFLKQIEKDIYKEGLDKNKVKLYKTKK